MMCYGWVCVAAVSLLAMAALACVSRAATYHLKFILFILTSLICATIPIPIMLLRPRNPKNALMPAWGLRQISNRLLGLRFEIRGLHNILEDSRSDTIDREVRSAGCVVLINHQSAIDLCVLAELWPIMPRCTVISKKEVFWLWPFGLATWLWGTVFIDRKDGGSARATVNTAGQAINNRGARVMMFPEGTRHGGRQLLSFKKGAFHLAIEAQCPVQPVIVSRYYFLECHNKRFDSGNAIVSILPAIPTKGLTRDDLPKLINHVYNVMTEAYETLSAEARTLNNNTHHKMH